MDSEESLHSHYWPGDGCIPITPQARRLGWAYDVYVTRDVWAHAITWTSKDNGKKNKSNADQRIFELLEGCWKGMGAALAVAPDMVSFKFKFWYWQRHRPNAKKPIRGNFAARLLLDPETEEPWVLIFNPATDHEGVLKYGEHEEDRTNEGDAGVESSGRDDPAGLAESGSPESREH